MAVRFPWDKSDLPGGKTEKKGNPFASLPKSEYITDFLYERDDYSLQLREEKEGLYAVTAEGGNPYERDGTKFIVSYNCADTRLLKNLNKIIKEQKLYLDNNHVIHVNGLPPKLGDTLSVSYDSGERIYRSSNQSLMLSDEQAACVYNAFLRDAKRMGFDFSTAGSSQPIYDDATEEYLQGTWKGTHFGTDVVAVFTGKHVTITYGGKLTDDTDYVIIEGSVKPDRTYESHGRTYYAGFNSCTAFHKNTASMITASVYREGASSSFQMIKTE